jgi:hypothetical protein
MNASGRVRTAFRAGTRWRYRSRRMRSVTPPLAGLARDASANPFAPLGLAGMMLVLAHWEPHLLFEGCKRSSHDKGRTGRDNRLRSDNVSRARCANCQSDGRSRGNGNGRPKRTVQQLGPRLASCRSSVRDHRQGRPSPPATARCHASRAEPTSDHAGAEARRHLDPPDLGLRPRRWRVRAAPLPVRLPRPPLWPKRPRSEGIRWVCDVPALQKASIGQCSICFGLMSFSATPRRENSC